MGLNVKRIDDPKGVLMRRFYFDSPLMDAECTLTREQLIVFRKKYETT